MENQKLYPLTFSPVLKDYIWGGRNLARYGRNLPAEGVIAESWEIAGHRDGTTLVNNGPYRGRSLIEMQNDLGLDLVGGKNAWAHERGIFPLLVKLLDANRPLSVQVHPDDNYALANEGNELGKTEMWVVLEAQPGAELILGVKEGTTKEAFQHALAAGEAAAYLHHLPVSAGDHICVPTGSLHAIMGGLVMVEILQNSNTTYRVFDWNRLGADGKPRQLHIDKALDVINFEQVEPGLCPSELVSEDGGIRRFRLCSNEYFVTERVEMGAGTVYHGSCDGDSLEIWGAIEGQVTVNGMPLGAVHFTLLPAAMGDYAIGAQGEATLLRTYVE